MKRLHLETPLIESPALSASAGRSVWLKMEALQPTGSFKIRGVGAACQEYARRGATRFLSSSGGNAGIAVAHAGRHLGLPVVVVVPETTTERAIALIEREGAKIVVHGASWQEANAHALSRVEESDAFLHPFDDPLLWQGHASLIDEVVRSDVRPDVVVLSVGGGGLLCGVVEGLQRHGWNDVPVVAVETEGADSLAQSLRAGRRVELAAITSLATSLGARQVGEQAFRHAQSTPCAALWSPIEPPSPRASVSSTITASSSSRPAARLWRRCTTARRSSMGIGPSWSSLAAAWRSRSNSCSDGHRSW